MEPKQGPDMRLPLESLRSKRRFRNINHDKLARIMACTELNVPQSWLQERTDLAVLRERGVTSFRIPKKAWRVLVPAGAAAALFIVVMSGLFDFMSGSHSGTAGIVSGDVVVRSGGSGRSLRAGDAVNEGDVVITGENSAADIHFGNLVHMRIIGGSRVTVRNVSLGRRARSFDALVAGGGCVMDVNKLAAGELVSIHTPASAGVVRGTRFGVMVGTDGRVLYEVFEGVVRVRRCLSPGGHASPDAAAALERYFRDHAIDLSGGQKCAIAPDAVSFGSLSVTAVQGAIAFLALPRPVYGTSVLKEEMDRLIRSSGGSEAVTGPGHGTPRGIFTATGAGTEPGAVSLMYIPVLDCVIRISDRSLTALRSGDVLWSSQLDSRILSLPAYEATSLYVPTGRSMVVKIDLFTGGTQWKASVPGGSTGIITLALDNSGLYCAASRGTLSKFDRGGELLWSADAGESLSARPVISAHMVFVSTRRGSLIGYDMSTGARVVRVSIRGSIASIAAWKNSVYIATDDGRLFCYDRGDDEMRWEYQVNDAPALGMSVSDHSVYLFGRGGRIYRFTPDGSLAWSRDLGIPIMKPPAEDAASFYVPARDSLFVVDKMTGSVTWSLLLPQITSSNVAVSKGHIYFETGKNRLSSLKK